MLQAFAAPIGVDVFRAVRCQWAWSGTGLAPLFHIGGEALGVSGTSPWLGRTSLPVRRRGAKSLEARSRTPPLKLGSRGLAPDLGRSQVSSGLPTRKGESGTKVGTSGSG